MVHTSVLASEASPLAFDTIGDSPPDITKIALYSSYCPLPRQLSRLYGNPEKYQTVRYITLHRVAGTKKNKQGSKFDDYHFDFSLLSLLIACSFYRKQLSKFNY